MLSQQSFPNFVSKSPANSCMLKGTLLLVSLSVQVFPLDLVTIGLRLHHEGHFLHPARTMEIDLDLQLKYCLSLPLAVQRTLLT